MASRIIIDLSRLYNLFGAPQTTAIKILEELLKAYGITPKVKVLEDPDLGVECYGDEKVCKEIRKPFANTSEILKKHYKYVIEFHDGYQVAYAAW